MFLTVGVGEDDLLGYFPQVIRLDQVRHIKETVGPETQQRLLRSSSKGLELLIGSESRKTIKP